MTEMVERVARAIERTFDEDCARVFDEGQADTLARAAIEAMRETDDSISGAGGTILQQEMDDDSRYPMVVAVQVWRAMIDAALK